MKRGAKPGPKPGPGGPGGPVIPRIPGGPGIPRLPGAPGGPGGQKGPGGQVTKPTQQLQTVLNRISKSSTTFGGKKLKQTFTSDWKIPEPKQKQVNSGVVSEYSPKFSSLRAKFSGQPGESMPHIKSGPASGPESGVKVQNTKQKLAIVAGKKTVLGTGAPKKPGEIGTLPKPSLGTLGSQQNILKTPAASKAPKPLGEQTNSGVSVKPVTLGQPRKPLVAGTPPIKSVKEAIAEKKIEGTVDKQQVIKHEKAIAAKTKHSNTLTEELKKYRKGSPEHTKITADIQKITADIQKIEGEITKIQAKLPVNTPTVPKPDITVAGAGPNNKGKTNIKGVTTESTGNGTPPKPKKIGGLSNGNSKVNGNGNAPKLDLTTNPKTRTERKKERKTLIELEKAKQFNDLNEKIAALQASHDIKTNELNALTSKTQSELDAHKLTINGLNDKITQLESQKLVEPIEPVEPVKPVVLDEAIQKDTPGRTASTKRKSKKTPLSPEAAAKKAEQDKKYDMEKQKFDLAKQQFELQLNIYNQQKEALDTQKADAEKQKKIEIEKQAKLEAEKVILEEKAKIEAAKQEVITKHSTEINTHKEGIAEHTTKIKEHDANIATQKAIINSKDSTPEDIKTAKATINTIEADKTKSIDAKNKSSEAFINAQKTFAETQQKESSDNLAKITADIEKLKTISIDSTKTKAENEKIKADNEKQIAELEKQKVIEEANLKTHDESIKTHGEALEKHTYDVSSNKHSYAQKKTSETTDNLKDISIKIADLEKLQTSQPLSVEQRTELENLQKEKTSIDKNLKTQIDEKNTALDVIVNSKTASIEKNNKQKTDITTKKDATLKLQEDSKSKIDELDNKIKEINSDPNKTSEKIAELAELEKQKAAETVTYDTHTKTLETQTKELENIETKLQNETLELDRIKNQKIDSTIEIKKINDNIKADIDKKHNDEDAETQRKLDENAKQEAANAKQKRKEARENKVETARLQTQNKFEKSQEEKSKRLDKIEEELEILEKKEAAEAEAAGKEGAKPKGIFAWAISTLFGKSRADLKQKKNNLIDEIEKEDYAYNKGLSDEANFKERLYQVMERKQQEAEDAELQRQVGDETVTGGGSINNKYIIKTGNKHKYKIITEKQNGKRKHRTKLYKMKSISGKNKIKNINKKFTKYKKKYESKNKYASKHASRY